MIFIDLTKAFDTLLINRNMQYREASLQLTYIFGVILCESEWMWLQMAGHGSWWQLHTQSTKTAAVEHLLFAAARIWCWKKMGIILLKILSEKESFFFFSTFLLPFH